MCLLGFKKFDRGVSTLLIQFLNHSITRNTLTQASKNGRKPYLFSQKKFVSVLYAINIYLTPSIISKWQTLIVRRENDFCKFYTFFGFVYHVSCLPWFETKNKNRCNWCPEVCIYTQKSTRIWKVYLNFSKCTWKPRFFYISITR